MPYCDGSLPLSMLEQAQGVHFSDRGEKDKVDIQSVVLDVPRYEPQWGKDMAKEIGF
jgi:hypothetical protein